MRLLSRRILIEVTLQHGQAGMAADLRHLSRSVALPVVPTVRVAVIEALPVEAPGQQPLRSTGSSGERSPVFVATDTRRSCQALWGFHFIQEKPVPNL